jgi:protein-disulfide isomerase-like protein with CxxC motif
VKIAKIDATQNRGMAQKYQIKGFPTLLLFVGDKKAPIPYSSERTAEAMVSWLESQ